MKRFSWGNVERSVFACCSVSSCGTFVEPMRRRAVALRPPAARVALPDSGAVSQALTGRGRSFAVTKRNAVSL